MKNKLLKNLSEAGVNVSQAVEALSKTFLLGKLNISKKDKILRLLTIGWQLSKMQMLEKCDCWNSGDVIYKLRKEGYDIKTRMETNKNTGSRFAVYYLNK